MLGKGVGQGSRPRWQRKRSLAMSTRRAYPTGSCCRILRHRGVHVHHNDLREVLGIAPAREVRPCARGARARLKGAVVLVGPLAPRLTITTLETAPAQFGFCPSCRSTTSFRRNATTPRDVVMFVADDFSWTGSVHKFPLHVCSLRELTPRRGGGAFRSPRFVRSTWDGPRSGSACGTTRRRVGRRACRRHRRRVRTAAPRG